MPRFRPTFAPSSMNFCDGIWIRQFVIVSELKCWKLLNRSTSRVLTREASDATDLVGGSDGWCVRAHHCRRDGPVLKRGNPAAGPDIAYTGRAVQLRVQAGAAG